MYYLFNCSGEMEPDQECCILQAQTQVIVSPKYRAFSGLSQSAAKRDEFASADIDNSETHGDASADEVASSPVNRLVAGVRWLLFGNESDSKTGNIVESLTYKSEAWNIKTKLICRVLALEDFAVSKLKSSSTGGTQQILNADEDCSNELISADIALCTDLSADSVDLMQQTTNVYVSIFTILSQLPAVTLDSVPDTFLAMLSRLRSPSEQLAANRIQRAKSAYSRSEDVKEADSQVNMQKVVVRVIVTKFNAESHASGFRFMQSVPQKHILISSLLRRQMNVSVNGRVILTPLCVPSDMCPTKINVYPLSSSVSCI